MNTRTVWLLIALTLALGVGQPAPAGSKEELAALQGTWKLVSFESDGEARDIPGPTPQWVIKGDKVLYAGRPLATLTLDASTTPRNVDLHFLKPKRDYEGVYSVSGDALKVCVNRLTEGVKERPLGFSTRGKGDWRLLVFKRQKAEGGDGSDGLAGFVGIVIGINRERKELILNQILGGSPAEDAGLKKGDVLVKVGAGDATDLRAVVTTVRQARPESELTFRVRRGGKERDVVVKVGVLPFHLFD